jgi:hypothetical protein
MSENNEAASYEETPTGQQARWTIEFSAARKALEPWQSKGDEIDREFRNEVSGDAVFDTRLSLFTADVTTMLAMLYGQVPRATVTRTFGDSNDDLGRVAGEILERVINTDIQRDSDTYKAALRCALMDFFLPGFAQMRCRYVTGEIKSEKVAAEIAPDGKVLVEEYDKESRPKEDVEIDYVHWKDNLWGPAKVVHMVPWWAHRSQMTKAELVNRFGEIGKLVNLSKRKDGSEDPWSRADVWEIYEKASRKVYWFVEGFERILDVKDDPLGLEGFFPFPEPLVANLTTSKVVPRPYYALHQDQYRQINMLMTRIHELVDAVRVAGFYDAENESLMQLLKLPGRNALFPVKNWGKLAGNGGIEGSVAWFPIDMVVQGIAVLQQQLVAEIDLLHQSTGFSDIMRGEATQAGSTATEQRAKTKFGSVRIQRLQDEIARFATDTLRIKGEIVCKHFAPETIYERANVRFMPEADEQIAMQAIALLKSDFACYRIEVKPEAVALADFAQMKAERLEALTTLTGFAGAIQPLVAAMPASLPYLLKIAQWCLAGIRGSSQIEGVFDQMIQAAETAAEQAAANPQAAPPDPKVQAEQLKQQTVQMKAGADMQREQLKQQGDLTRIAAEVQADASREETQAMWNVRESTQKAVVTHALKASEPQRGSNGREKP